MARRPVLVGKIAKKDGLPTAWSWLFHWIPTYAGMPRIGAGIMKSLVIPGIDPGSTYWR